MVYLNVNDNFFSLMLNSGYEGSIAKNNNTLTRVKYFFFKFGNVSQFHIRVKQNSRNCIAYFFFIFRVTKYEKALQNKTCSIYTEVRN